MAKTQFIFPMQSRKVVKKEVSKSVTGNITLGEISVDWVPFNRPTLKFKIILEERVELRHF